MILAPCNLLLTRAICLPVFPLACLPACLLDYTDLIHTHQLRSMCALTST